MPVIQTAPRGGDTLYNVPANVPNVPYPETVSSKVKRIRTVLDYGAIPGGEVDCTAAFTRAMRSGKTVWVPDDMGPYLIAGEIVADVASSRLYGDGNPQIIVPHGNPYLTLSATGIHIRRMTFLPAQVNTNYQLRVSPGADRAQIRDVAIHTGNSGIVVEARNAHLQRIWMTEMRGTAIRLNGARSCVIENVVLRNVCLAGIIAEGASWHNTIRTVISKTEPEHWNAWIQSEVDRLVAQGVGTPTTLGGDVFACNSTCQFNRVYDVYREGPRDGCITFSGPNNSIDGGTFVGGHGSGVAVAGDNCTVSNCTAIACKTGFYVVPNFGGTGKRTRFIGCRAYNCAEYGFRAQDNNYREWVAGQTYSSDARFCYYGLNVYQCTSAFQWGTIPPTHTSGTVSDGINDLTWLASHPETLDSDYTEALGCLSVGSGIANWALWGRGRFDLIGCAGTPEPVYTLPSRSGISGAGEFRFRGRTVDSAPIILTTDGLSPQQNNTIRLRVGTTLILRAEIAAVGADGRLVTWDARATVRRGSDTVTDLISPLVNRTSGAMGTEGWSVQIGTVPSRGEVTWTCTGSAEEPVNWTMTVNISDPAEDYGVIP